MITAVDTNVLLDVLIPDEQFNSHSSALLSHARDAGEIIVSHIVFAELHRGFDDRAPLDAFLANLDITLSPIDDTIAWEAGRRFQQYRLAGGSRQRIIADFLIGAHAGAKADVFLTRDRGFFATYFPELRTLTIP